MIIFCTGQATKTLNSIKNCLPPDLSLNNEKTSVVSLKRNEDRKYYLDNNSNEFEYLGYRISLNVSSNKNKFVVDVGIARKKIDKIKLRLLLSVKSFIKDNNKALFFDRVKFLTGNHRIKGNYGWNKLYSGVYYNYKLMDGYEGSKSTLEELDSFLQSLIFNRKKKLSSELRILLDKKEILALSSYRFSTGFTEKKVNNLNDIRISEIKKAWENHA